MPPTTMQPITPLIIASLTASTLVLAVVAWKMCERAQAANARAARAEAAALRAANEQERASQPPATVTAAQQAALAHLRSALTSMQTAAERYRELAGMLERQLIESQHEIEDWQAAVNYHLETIRGLTADRDRMREQLETLQNLYASRTQAALKAGLIRFVVGDDAGFMR